MLMDEQMIKQRVQKWIVAIGAVILCGKFMAFYLTNSVGILTDATESIVNVVAGLISLYSLRWAAKPRDRQHPFGHGKMELISASIEGLLISIAGGLIVYEGFKRLLEPSAIEKLDIGIVVVAVAGAINYVMGWYSIRVGRQHNSIALIAGGKHLQSDAYSTVGLLIGLLLLYWTKISWIDSALALLFGSIIIFTGVDILRKTVTNLLDKADDHLLCEMAETMEQHRQHAWIDVHNAKIIKYGNYLYIDCDLTLPWYYNLVESHDACCKLRNTLIAQFSERIQVSIHADPCNKEHCDHCPLEECPTRQSPFLSLEQLNLSRIIESDEERNEY